MWAWAAILLVMVGVTVLGFFYISSRLRLFSFIGEKFSTKKARLISFLTVFALLAVLYITLGMMNAIVAVIHLLVIWLICDLISLIFRKISHRERKKYIAGAVAIILTAVYLGTGAFFAFHIFRTSYIVHTEKSVPSGSIRIVGFSDSHMGTTLDAQELAGYVEKINGENPDIVVIVGDFVDDNTSLEMMEDSCKALSALTPKYGAYYVFGNHDAGYYSETHRGYGKRDLTKILEENGVTVLEDETEIIADSVAVIGRRDKGMPTRKSADELTAGLDEYYKLILDHQPGDYDAEAKAGADLVLSGHTHGGQMLPINWVGEWIGVNDHTYGHTERENTDFIISSGISDWELYFKTGCISEYFVIDIEK